MAHMKPLIKVRHPLLRSSISRKSALRHFQGHADAVLEGIDVTNADEREALMEELAVWAELVSLTGERAKTIRNTQPQKKSVRRIRKTGKAYFKAIFEADQETKERLLQYLGKFADDAPKGSEHDDVEAIQAAGQKAYTAALETIARIGYFAKRTVDGRGPKATPLFEVVTALASVWERHTGQPIVNTRNDTSTGFPAFVRRFMKAAHAIAAAKEHTVWQPAKKGVKYNEFNALKTIIEEVRIMSSSPANA